MPKSKRHAKRRLKLRNRRRTVAKTVRAKEPEEHGYGAKDTFGPR